MEMKQWEGFLGNTWKNEINVRDFIAQNYSEYLGDEGFLADATPRTNELRARICSALLMLSYKGSHSMVARRKVLPL